MQTKTTSYIFKRISLDTMIFSVQYTTASHWPFSNHFWVIADQSHTWSVIVSAYFFLVSHSVFELLFIAKDGR